MNATQLKSALSTAPISFIRRGYANKPMHRALPRPRDPLLSSTKAIIKELEPGLTFVKRPPPSAPSPHSLTTAPASPLLRPLPLTNSLPTSSSSSSTSSPSTSSALGGEDKTSLPPVLGRGPPEKRFHLTEEQIAEMRELRRADPIKNTVISIARRFDCSRAFVQISAPLSNSLRRKRVKELEAEKEKWNDRKKLVREIRQRRRLFW